MTARLPNGTLILIRRCNELNSLARRRRNSVGSTAGVWLLGFAALLSGCRSSEGVEAGQDPPELLTPPAGAPRTSELDAMIDSIAGFTSTSGAAEQVAIAECMQEQGFDYIIPAGDDTQPSEVPQVDDAAYRADHGYGISITPEQPAESQDPNSALLDAMSDSERQRYEAALHGTPAGETPITDANGVEVGFYYADSCVAKASLAVYGLTSGERQDIIDQLESARNGLVDRMRADQRYIDSWNAWSDCMATSGYEASDRYAAIELVHQKFADDPAAGAVFETEVASADNVCAASSDVDAQSFALRYSYDQQVLEQFQQAMSQVTLP